MLKNKSGSDDDSVKEMNENEDDDDDDDEEERWEKEQIRKGVQISQVGKHLIYKSLNYCLIKKLLALFLKKTLFSML